jgi:hypothetical protein
MRKAGSARGDALAGENGPTGRSPRRTPQKARAGRRRGGAGTRPASRERTFANTLDHVSLAPLKVAALRLPSNHPARFAILSEPDKLPWADYAARAVVWFRLLMIPAG